MRSLSKYKIAFLLLLLYTFPFGDKTLFPKIKQIDLNIVDYRKYLNKKFKKKKRKSTKYIIIHTSEAGKISTLRTLSDGKRVGRKKRTKGGHANYAVLRNGRIYRILSRKYKANHAGLSMWNGLKNLSYHSIGIELVGYHYGKITFEQYRSLTPLIKELQNIYKIPDKNILTHSQVSFGKPNLWFKNNHRGRKRCALNFNRARAGLVGRWTYDPDVRSKRLTSDYQTKKVFYSEYNTNMVKISPNRTEKILKTAKIEEAVKQELVTSSNIISAENTAWNIAGEDYNDSETIYILPDGKRVRGDFAGSKIGWSNIPSGTKVILHQPKTIKDSDNPVKIISGDFTAWSYAGKEYKNRSTFYILPNGKIKNGTRIKDWDSLPSGVKMIVNYIGPYPLGSTKGKTAWGIAGKYFNKKETVYVIPGIGVVTGDKMRSFNNLPKYSKLFLKRR